MDTRKEPEMFDYDTGKDVTDPYKRCERPNCDWTAGCIHGSRPDYHQRFRERFPTPAQALSRATGSPIAHDTATSAAIEQQEVNKQNAILAFIDEVVAQTERRKDEEHIIEVAEMVKAVQTKHAALVKMIEGMRRPDFEDHECIGGLCHHYPRTQENHRLVDDLLTHLRGEKCECGGHTNKLGKWHAPYCSAMQASQSPTQEETECCERCDINQGNWDGRMAACVDGDCPCHKPRTEAPKECNPVNHLWQTTDQGAEMIPDPMCPVCSPITSEEKGLRGKDLGYGLTKDGWPKMPGLGTPPLLKHNHEVS